MAQDRCSSPVLACASTGSGLRTGETVHILRASLRASSGFLDIIGFFIAEPLTEKDPVVGTCVP